MTKKINYLYVLALFGGLITACKKSEPSSYMQADRIYFYKDNYISSKDSTVYSFAIRSDALIQDTVKIPLRIMGVAAGHDRTVTIQVVTDSSTALPQQYELLPTIVKAGDYTTDVSLLVKRGPALKTNDVRLLLEIGTSDDFLPGVYNSAASPSMGGGSVRYPVRINDYLTKPANWDIFCAGYFGAYSDVKYKLVIDATGRAEFPDSGDDRLGFSEMTFYKKQCRYYLADMNAANGTNLKDENGNLITFPD